ncbi:MAG: transcriptional regulator NrdR [Candidatus Pacearchaeota archaeon]
MIDIIKEEIQYVVCLPIIMKCTFCQHHETKVTNKRDTYDGTRRRRECLKCKRRFTTYEKIEPIERYVIKKDGRRERFERDKAFLSIIKACEKRNISHESVDKTIRELEEKVLQKNKEIPTKKIGEFIMKKLKKMDKVAYIRFASVYRDFDDVSDFKNILNEVK